MDNRGMSDDPNAPESVPFRNRIRSYVRRAGRTTAGQARALEQLGPRFLLPYQATPMDLAQAFGRAAPTVLEIGFGMGEATAHIAGLMPEQNFLCCEVHPPGVGSLLRLIGERGLTNIRIVQHDAVEVLDHMLAPASLAGAHIFFPDPWHKARHNKRRLVQPPFVAKLVTRLQGGGYLHCATDWEPYAQQMLEVLMAERRRWRTRSRALRPGRTTGPSPSSRTAACGSGQGVGRGVPQRWW
jgi:tRNA (guanine-N7-)-methyltransferase